MQAFVRMLSSVLFSGLRVSGVVGTHLFLLVFSPTHDEPPPTPYHLTL